MVYLSGSIHETAVWRIKSSFYLNTMDNTLEFLLVFFIISNFATILSNSFCIIDSAYFKIL